MTNQWIFHRYKVNNLRLIIKIILVKPLLFDSGINRTGRSKKGGLDTNKIRTCGIHTCGIHTCRIRTCRIRTCGIRTRLPKRFPTARITMMKQYSSFRQVQTNPINCSLRTPVSRLSPSLSLSLSGNQLDYLIARFKD